MQTRLDHADRNRDLRAKAAGRPLRETTLSSSAEGSFVESPLSAIKAHEDAEEASIAERLGATASSTPSATGPK
jgi:hypothetical protein